MQVFSAKIKHLPLEPEPDEPAEMAAVRDFTAGLKGAIAESSVPPGVVISAFFGVISWIHVNAFRGGQLSAIPTMLRLLADDLEHDEAAGSA